MQQQPNNHDIAGAAKCHAGARSRPISSLFPLWTPAWRNVNATPMQARVGHPQAAGRPAGGRRPGAVMGPHPTGRT